LTLLIEKEFEQFAAIIQNGHTSIHGQFNVKGINAKIDNPKEICLQIEGNGKMFLGQ
jgi:hypothetical protein